MKLKEKVVVITGASDGIGKEIALRLAKEWAKLAIIARDEERLHEVCQKAKQLWAMEAKGYACDLRETDSLSKTIQAIASDFSWIDILINNAGIRQKLMPVEEIDQYKIDEIIATNLSAVIHTTRLCIPYLKQKEESAILNIVSKSGVVAQAGQSVYTASKYGVRWFTETLKADLKDSKVRVAGIYQSGTNTKMFEKAGNTPPVENFTNPADLADVVAYMLSLPEKIWLHDVRVEY